ncbi:MAG: 2-C-methyl-D-erythritol 2,4-cyclodiphosphate synthase, partial [Clostridia bacterium]|nr:2-C-methyl-D-erythritol 2,4-cyclodiphosphate synthase [Clostridia bacterium]
MGGVPVAETPGGGLVRVGIGFDVHPFAPGRRLVLGGVEFPGEVGLAGHSDADVLSHAVADALLGAAGLGDIGHHFPDTDPAWRGVSSLFLLERVAVLVAEAGYAIANVDATLLLERPRVAPRVHDMVTCLAGALGVAVGSVNVKATTAEGLG